MIYIKFLDSDFKHKYKYLTLLIYSIDGLNFGAINDNALEFEIGDSLDTHKDDLKFFQLKQYTLNEKNNIFLKFGKQLYPKEVPNVFYIADKQIIVKFKSNAHVLAKYNIITTPINSNYSNDNINIENTSSGIYKAKEFINDIRRGCFKLR